MSAVAPGIKLRELLLQHGSEIEVNEFFRFMMLKKFAHDTDHSAVFAPAKIDKLWTVAISSPAYQPFVAQNIGFTVERISKAAVTFPDNAADQRLVAQYMADHALVAEMEQNTAVAYRVLFKSDAPKDVWDECLCRTPATKAAWVVKLARFNEYKLSVSVNKLNHPKASAVIEVTHATTADEFRAQVESALGVAPADQVYLTDMGDTIGRSAVGNGDSIPMYTTAKTGVGAITLNVRTLTGKVLSFNVETHIPVVELKALIARREGIPPDQQRLIYAGKQLEDDRTLLDYNVDGTEVITLVLRLRGC